jgi:hypothetical protein
MEAPTELVEGGEQFVEDADSIDYTMEALTSSGYSKKTVEKVPSSYPPPSSSDTDGEIYCAGCHGQVHH